MPDRTTIAIVSNVTPSKSRMKKLRGWGVGMVADVTSNDAKGNRPGSAGKNYINFKSQLLNLVE
jgi:hypothetical protein